MRIYLFYIVDGFAVGGHDGTEPLEGFFNFSIFARRLNLYIEINARLISRGHKIVIFYPQRNQGVFQLINNLIRIYGAIFLFFTFFNRLQFFLGGLEGDSGKF